MTISIRFRVPSHNDLTSAESRIVHIPRRNLIGGLELGYVPLRWYAKRPKLYAAFQKFHYQLVELEYATNSDRFLPMAQHFASFFQELRLLVKHGGRSILHVFFNALSRFIETGDPGLMKKPGASPSIQNTLIRTSTAFEKCFLSKTLCNCGVGFVFSHGPTKSFVGVICQRPLGS